MIFHEFLLSVLCLKTKELIGDPLILKHCLYLHGARGHLLKEFQGFLLFSSRLFQCLECALNNNYVCNYTISGYLRQPSAISRFENELCSQDC